MSELLRDRSVHKYYCCIVKGKMEGTQHLKGYLVKDHATNQVRVSKELTKNEEAQPIETKYRVITSDGNLTLLEVLLLTGAAIRSAHIYLRSDIRSLAIRNMVTRD